MDRPNYRRPLQHNVTHLRPVTRTGTNTISSISARTEEYSSLFLTCPTTTSGTLETVVESSQSRPFQKDSRSAFLYPPVDGSRKTNLSCVEDTCTHHGSEVRVHGNKECPSDLHWKIFSEGSHLRSLTGNHNITNPSVESVIYRLTVDLGPRTPSNHQTCHLMGFRTGKGVTQQPYLRNSIL